MLLLWDSIGIDWEIHPDYESLASRSCVPETWLEDSRGNGIQVVNPNVKHTLT